MLQIYLRNYFSADACFHAEYRKLLQRNTVVVVVVMGGGGLWARNPLHFVFLLTTSC